MFEARTRLGRWTLQVILTLMVLPFLLPIVAMVQGSFKGQGWGNYLAVFSRPELPLFFRNSVIIAALTLVLVFVCALPAAFAFSKLRIRRRELFFWLLLACLTLPEVVILTPLFVTAINLGVYNTYFAVVLPLAALEIPFMVLLARTFMDGLPDELLDSAAVDGATTFRAFLLIVVPLTRPIAAAIFVLTLIAAWNNYLLPLVLLLDPSTQPITMLPQFFVSEFSDDETKVLASAVITALPEIIAYLCLQRLFERGLAAGAIK